MDPRLLTYYNRELQHLREMGGEFAQEFPKVAARLGLEGFECADPYVERLLEGFAFLTARVQLKLDTEFPRFTQHLLSAVYPHYLAPTPSMAVVQLQPDLSEGSLAAGFEVPRGTSLRSILGKNDQTACEYRTAHPVTLWPIELAEAKYFTYAGDLSTLPVPDLQRVKAGVRLRLRTGGQQEFSKLGLNKLCLYLRGSDELPMQLYERLIANAVALVVRPAGSGAIGHTVLPKANIRRVGYADDESLLPYGSRSFHGYRLLHEYFAFPQRFLFLELSGLAPAVQQCTGNELEILVLLDRSETQLEATVSKANFALYCTPAINLFPKRCDRIHLSDKQPEYHIVADRTRPMDYEIFAVTRVTGHGTSAQEEQEFLPFYAFHDLSHQGPKAYYTIHRLPRMLSSRQRRHGPRSSYIGTEVYVSLVDESEAPYPSHFKQLAVAALCTNRDLPLAMPVGVGDTDFTVEIGGPIAAVRCLEGPTQPMPAHPEGDHAWRLISHLSLNYLSITDTDAKKGAEALRDLLRLYSLVGDAALQKQIEGIKSVSSKPIVRRLPIPGPITFGRGLELSVTCDDAAFAGGSVFLLGAVIEQFFSKFTSINSFTETVVRTLSRGEIRRWPAHIGLRHVI
jgi:type VI secretion system protein ImpG